MNEVSGRWLLSILRLRGLSTHDLLSERSVTLRSLQQSRARVDWDDVVEILQRMETACGGPQAMESLFEGFHVELPEALMAITRALVSPRSVFLFSWRVVAPSNYTFIRVGADELAGGRVRGWGKIPPPYRGSAPFFRATIGVCRATPAMVGLPADEMTMNATYDERHIEVMASFRPSRTLAARMRRALAKLGAAAASEMAHIQKEYSDRRPRSTERAPSETARAAAVPWGLTSRQREVAESILLGRSNKEIAVELGCSERTVEAHLTDLHRKVGADSRLALAARLRERN